MQDVADGMAVQDVEETTIRQQMPDRTGITAISGSQHSTPVEEKTMSNSSSVLSITSSISDSMKSASIPNRVASRRAYWSNSGEMSIPVPGAQQSPREGVGSDVAEQVRQRFATHVPD